MLDRLDWTDFDDHFDQYRAQEQQERQRWRQGGPTFVGAIIAGQKPISSGFQMLGTAWYTVLYPVSLVTYVSNKWGRIW